jgi:hypothetical protein
LSERSSTSALNSACSVGYNPDAVAWNSIRACQLVPPVHMKQCSTPSILMHFFDDLITLLKEQSRSHVLELVGNDLRSDMTRTLDRLLHQHCRVFQRLPVIHAARAQGSRRMPKDAQSGCPCLRSCGRPWSELGNLEARELTLDIEREPGMVIPSLRCCGFWCNRAPRRFECDCWRTPTRLANVRSRKAAWHWESLQWCCRCSTSLRLRRIFAE